MGEKRDVEGTAGAAVEPELETTSPVNTTPASQPPSTSLTAPTSDKPPTPFTVEWWWRALQDKFGRRAALVILAAALVAVFGWENWNDVKDWPVLRSIHRTLVEARLPQPKEGMFNVGIAHLARDTNREQEQKVRVALQELQGVNVGFFDRTIVIAATGKSLQEALQQGHADAARYLEKSRFDTLLWGEVLASGPDPVLKLYWTPAAGMGKGHSTEQFTFNKDQTLPKLFWGELADVLRLVVIASASGLPEGRFVADKAQSFVDRVRNLLSDRLQKGWTPETTAEVQVVFGKALTILGEQTGRSKYLIEAIDNDRDALKERTRERVPLDWAMTQNNLGTALRTLGERESGTAHLTEAVTAYRAALAVFSPDMPYYDRTQQNLTKAEQLIQRRHAG